MKNEKHSIEIGDIFQEHAESFLKTNKLNVEQLKAFNAIISCRTSQLGGHRKRCNECGHIEQAYNSCRNRHCPKCQFVKKAQWVDKLNGNLPPVKHFHLVFTIPLCLNKLFYINQYKAYGLLFKAAGQALKDCSSNTSYLGAETGAVALLHTWGQNLFYHPHIHMMVPAGGLSEDQTEWIPSAKNFFLPVKALSKRFRSILVDLLDKATANGEMKLPDEVNSFILLRNQCYKTNWVVYSEKPFKTPRNLINYLGNYTHRIAISNQRIIKHEKGKVSFYYKDYKKGGIRKVMTLDAHEFIRRFLQNVLPKGFSKIRYFGFLSLRYLKDRVKACIALIEKNSYIPELEGLNAVEVLERVTGINPFQCPQCKRGKLIPVWTGEVLNTS